MAVRPLGRKAPILVVSGFLSIWHEGVIMKHILSLPITLAIVLTLSLPVAAQDLGSSVVGVWQLKSSVRKELATGNTVNVYDDNPTGRWTFTRGGHFTWVTAAGDRKAPVNPTVTDAERIQLFKTLAFGSGTYRVDGNKVVARYDLSWIQSWTGTERTFEVQIAGKTMTIPSAPFKNTADGKESITISTWDRVE